MSQQQFEQPRRRPEQESVEQLRPAQAQQAQQIQQTDSSLDDLLDQIDAVIERNPQGYVRNFVQRGGQ